MDDSINTREIEKSILEDHGYRVSLAEDGIDALEKAAAGDFDLIVTSREKEQDKLRGIEVGADAYIVKGSFDRNNLLDTIGNLIG